MSAYIIAAYDIENPELYEPYVPGVLALLQQHNADVVVGDFEAQSLEGEARGVNVVIKFASEEAAMAWYNDPDYEPVKKIRLDSCKNCNLVLVKEFVPPAA